MSTAIIVVLSIAAIIGLLKPFEGKRSRNRDRPQDKNPFYATSIGFQECACEVVKAFGTHRFLVGEALPIPVPECDSKNCECVYIHHQDRRATERDRRCPSGLHDDGGAWGLRGSQGRRKSDWKTAMVGE